ncbi:NTP/NDP exchange transporter [Fodinicurvata fenggangensis]|uniref:NTP/NDP exchange transporter n=1 Tax=Fodinicurvata fenggangensis TaxID=1121830 RepID=UPI0004790FC5|nr:MFS transporter [Fodinicurvata fenggangensis]
MPVLQGIKARIDQALNLQDREFPALVLAFIYFFCLLGGYYILRPVRDQMGIAGGVENLQWLFTGTFVAMLCAVPAFGWLVARFPRRQFMPAVYRFFMVNLALFWLLFQWPEAEVHTARAFFIWVSVYNLFVISVFWSYMADIFTKQQGTRLFGAIAAGGTLGALTGPALTALLADSIGTVNLLLITAVLLEVAVFCIRRLARFDFRSAAEHGDGERESRPIGGNILAGATAFFRSPHLLGIGAFILLYTFTSTFLYFQQAEIIENAFDDPDRQTQVFAIIDLSVNLLTLGLQLFVTGRLLQWAGTRFGLTLLPVLSAIGFLGLAMSPGLIVLVGFQSLRRASNYAITRPSREVLFTAVPTEQRYKAKNFIDTVVYRGGDAFTGWLYSGLGALGLGLAGTALLAVPVALIWLFIGLWIGQRHDRQTEGQSRTAETPS